jgi:hypothetical protein
MRRVPEGQSDVQLSVPPRSRLCAGDAGPKSDDTLWPIHGCFNHLSTKLQSYQRRLLDTRLCIDLIA